MNNLEQHQYFLEFALLFTRASVKKCIFDLDSERRDKLISVLPNFFFFD